MTVLNISPDLRLPLDLVVQKTAILARSGAGKTNAAVVVAEEALAAGQQVLILDPPGAWWGLRSSADGRSAGYPIAVLGGLHGDLPLEPTSGALVADLAVDQGISAVLDLSEFTDGETARFVAAFGQRLYARKNAARDPLLLIVEEADELAPQNVKPDQTLMLHAIERLAKRGRMRGIGLLLITQRSAALNKHVLSQIEVLVAMQTTDPRDIKAIDEWVERHGDQERRRQLLTEIASLPVGTAFVWSPAWLRTFQCIRFRTRSTFDSSATPEPGKRQVAPKTLAAVDLEQIRSHMAATIEQAKANDPAELRRRVTELERQLSERPTETLVETQIERVEVPALAPDLVRDLEATVRDLAAVADHVLRTGNQVREAIEAALEKLKPNGPSYTGPVRPIATVPREHRRPPPFKPVERPKVPADGERPTAPQLRILDTLAMFARRGLHEVSKSNVAVFSAQSPKSSGFANNLGRLRSLGLIDYPAGGMVVITDAGRALAAVDDAPFATLDALHEAWRLKLSAPQWRILEVLIRSYPQPVDRMDLAAEAGQSHSSSGYANNLGALRSLRLLDYPTRGQVVATALLFPRGLGAAR